MKRYTEKIEEMVNLLNTFPLFLVKAKNAVFVFFLFSFKNVLLLELLAHRMISRKLKNLREIKVSITLFLP